ncbi:MAG: hypothetical protein ACREIF_17535 [Chthoniobacterales bacterium]
MIRINNLAVGNRTHFIKRLAMRIAPHRPNVHPFMETGVNRLARQLLWVAHKAVLAALPWMGNHSVQVAFDHLIKAGLIPA